MGRGSGDGRVVVGRPLHRNRGNVEGRLTGRKTEHIDHLGRAFRWRRAKVLSIGKDREFGQILGDWVDHLLFSSQDRGGEGGVGASSGGYSHHLKKDT